MLNTFTNWATSIGATVESSIAKWKNGDNELIVEYVDLNNPEVAKKLTKSQKYDGIIHIYSSEWINKQYEWQGIIKAKLGMFDRSIGARECNLVELTKDEFNTFANVHHLQGGARSFLKGWGLVNDGCLMGAISIGKHHRWKRANVVVLNRLCFAHGVNVMGGSAKLLKPALDWAKSQNKYDELITYSDNRWTNGSLYESLGFSESRVQRSNDYMYLKDGLLESKQSHKKTNKSPVGLTETEIAENDGYVKIWGYGKKTWFIKLNKNYLTWNEKLSHSAAEQHKDGHSNKRFIRGDYLSNKAGVISFASSLELRCLYLLDLNADVNNFERGPTFLNNEGRSRNPDFKITFRDGHVELWEIKPYNFQHTPAVIKQINDTKVYARSMGWPVYIWTEMDSGIDGITTDAISGKITDWAREWLNDHGNPEYKEAVTKAKKAKRSRFYAKQQRLLIESKCTKCSEVKSVMKLYYDKSIKDNSNYLCLKCNGKKIGSLPKDYLKKTNPLAASGEKQCFKCKLELSLLEFSENNAKYDGYNHICKKCVCEQQKATRDHKKAEAPLVKYDSNNQPIIDLSQKFVCIRCINCSDRKGEDIFHALEPWRLQENIAKNGHYICRDSVGAVNAKKRASQTTKIIRISKICNKCSLNKPISEFYSRGAVCKECSRKTARLTYNISSS